MRTQASNEFKVALAAAGALVNRKVALALCLAVWFLGPSFSANAQEGTFVTFDAPGAGTGAGQGTVPLAIDPAGTITGFYTDAATGTNRGFVRAPDGAITTFDGIPWTIGLSGRITGTASTGGFLRTPDGTVTTFVVPDANGVFPSSISPAADITGTYFDANVATHGFLRAPDGKITAFDAPGAGTGFFQGTWALSINPPGAVAGCYLDSNYLTHGFLRARDGTISTFDAPDAGTLSCFLLSGAPGNFPYHFGTFPLVGINPAEAITGSYLEPISGNWRGFLRAKDGSFTTFDAVPSPSSPCCTWTFGIAINPAGVIAGFDNDAASVNHGFVRAKDGTVIILDAPGAGIGSSFPRQGTIALAINPGGRVAGPYVDPNNVIHGFLWIPPSQ
jgi:hypothetical protein